MTLVEGKRPKVAAPVKTRPITVHVTEKVYANIAQRAQVMGRTPSAYAGLLFDAAYAARVLRERGEKPDDRELDLMVVTVFALADCEPEFIAEATGFSQTLVEKVLKGFSIVAREQDKATAPAPDKAETAIAWTAERRAELGALWAEGLTAAVIAERMGTTAGAIYQFAAENRDVCPKRSK